MESKEHAPERAGISLSFVLPLLDMIVWIILVLVPVTVTFVNMQQDAKDRVGSGASGEAGLMALPWQRVLSFVVDSSSADSYHTIMALDTPGMFGEAVVDSVTSWPDSWRPRGFLLESWRSITIPFFCLPAWWFVGKGLDCMLFGRRLHWVSFLTGSIFFALFVVVYFGLRFGLPTSDRADPDSAWILWGVGLWAALFAVFPTAWIRQFRNGRATG